MNGLHLIILRKHGEVYIFIFDKDNAISIFDQIIDFAENPELSFSPENALKVSSRLKEIILDSAR